MLHPLVQRLLCHQKSELDPREVVPQSLIPPQLYRDVNWLVDEN
jgi:cbb3-type cytochrome oxidase cytochrome c subunit